MDVAANLYTSAQVRGFDARAIDAPGIAGGELMRRAAGAALDELQRRWPQARRIVIACGPGNNGGDGFLLGALARARGLDVWLAALTPASRGDAAQARATFLDAGGRIVPATATTELPDADVHVDALFGSGFDRPLEGVAAHLVTQIGHGGTPVLALDVPSGFDADRGRCLGPCVQAQATICFVAWKRGLFTGEGAQACGERMLATLGLPATTYADVAPDAILLREECPPRRRRDAHKGDFGHVLVAAGDLGFGGAARLAGEAALRSGAGRVSVATRAEHVAPLLAARPELMVHAIREGDAVPEYFRHADVVLCGPGLGRGAWGRALFDAALHGTAPLVLDADGLNLLAAQPRDFRGRAVVLTPHPGEAARLAGSDVATIEADRFAAVRELARRYAAVVVLKGSGSLVAAPDGRVAVCPWGNPGMATAGMGDVLGGVIAAWLAQGLDPWRAACLGTGLHARAGDAAARAQGERGLLASDLFPHLHHLANADA